MSQACMTIEEAGKQRSICTVACSSDADCEAAPGLLCNGVMSPAHCTPPNGDKGVGAVCSSDDECDHGICFTTRRIALGEGVEELRTCSAPCVGAADCPDGFECSSASGAVGKVSDLLYCVPAAP